ncbi:YcaO-like family protein [Streptomyces sp. NPDC058254]|uniref:YcaO-like family protein n=1 Tax=Streptomyces sp. NPDC058254 TaxID=3346406 RepID=UPI0036EF9E9F
MHIHRFDGTLRTRPPEETWQSVKPLLAGFGITRVADVTGLDDLGIPVTMAVRPLSQTLSVAQGKGATLTAARVSAAMEAIEVWHAERAVPPVIETHTAAKELQLPYDVRTLDLHDGHLVTDAVRMDWVLARCALTDDETLVPESVVRLGRAVHQDWRLHLPSASTNGLASGNSRSEAIAHALCEVIERDALTHLDHTRPGEIIDPSSVTDAHCAALLAKLNGCWLELRHVGNEFRVPVMTCHLWREDQSAAIVSGSGAHPDPAVALSRAITEAVQTRLTQITGSREDCLPLIYSQQPHAAPRTCEQAAVDWHLIARRYSRPASTDTDVARALARAVHQASGHAPLIVDLTRGTHLQESFSVVKVIAPELHYGARHTVPRPLEAR